MVGKNNSSRYYRNSEDDYVDAKDKASLGLPLEKLNLGPRKKLLVLNLNGLLVNRIHRSSVNKIPKSSSPDAIYRNFKVFRRPFVEQFMKFCLDRFEVGIWSSAIEHNIEDALSCSIGSSAKKLLFVWDQNQCLNSGFTSLEKVTKPLFFKELKKVWGKIKKGGPYLASNTLLIDDKPYKAFLNPPNTGIFPDSYKVENEDDKALDPKGKLCLYLEGLANANDFPSYVKANPFGQSAITSSHSDWVYYCDVQGCIKRRIYQK
ncbi:hypothetical protein TanjilG_30887 [Lupinus angustifolius]|uniref:Mitochondrial import inner membrane translocase subunit TIM50 n=1 Tax=Lupinus angustifolius TaxID=3871 RepID=A0A394D9K9_LUPAN|nr:PREDICTED: uncharacterized protein LOC109337578 [Lupinus angustifolius]OIW19953.1 hypothetical protein TanjilG_30887 [Lupinus angustifolius]